MRLAGMTALGAVLLFGCGGSSEPVQNQTPAAAVSGKVLVDGAAAAGETVVLQGSNVLASAVTGADGSYTFDHLANGTYVLSSDVASTEEHHEQVVVTAQSSVSVPALTFTGVGSVSGTVVDPNGAPVANAVVRISGTSLATPTDDTGAFSVSEVPSGAHTLSVSTDAGAATASATVTRGADAAVSLTLVRDVPANGTVAGSVSFVSHSDLTLVQLSVPAAGVTAQAQADGTYSLDLPPGEWDVFAQAPAYPVQKVAHVQVASGATTALPTYTLSLYQPLPQIAGGYTWSVPAAIGGSHRTHLLLHAQNSSAGMYLGYAFDRQTGQIQLISTSNSASTPMALSPDGHWAAVAANDSLLIEDLTSGSSYSVGPFVQPNQLSMSGDSNTLTFTSNETPAQFNLLVLATKAVTSIPSYQNMQAGPDRTLVKITNTAPINWDLVTPQGVTPAFTNVPSLGSQYSNVAGERDAYYGGEACTDPACPFWILGTSATTAVQASGVTVASGSVGSINTGASRHDWLTVTGYDGNVYVVHVTDGTSLALPAGDTAQSISQNGAMYSFESSDRTQLFVHALPLPDPATLTPVITSTAAVGGSWISDTRYVGEDTAPVGGAAPYLFTIDNGTATLDTNFQAGTLQTWPFASSWIGTDGTVYFQGGAGAPIAAPSGKTTAPAAASGDVSIQDLYTLGAGTHVFARWDNSVGYILGGAAPIPVPLYGTTPQLILNGYLVATGGNTLVAVNASTGQAINIEEPGISFAGSSLDLSVADNDTFLVDNRVSSTGEVTGVYADFPSLL